MAISGEIEKLERRWQENPSGLMFAPLAEAHRKAGNHERALEILELGLAVHPDYVPALIVRGRCHLDAADLVGAEAAFQQVLARDPMNPIALRGVADVYERSGRSSLSLERLEMPADQEASPAVPPAEPEAPPMETSVVEATLAPEEAEVLPAIDFIMIENLSIDPIAPEPVAEPVAELRLPWEPLPDLEPSFGKLTWTPAAETDSNVAEAELLADAAPPVEAELAALPAEMPETESPTSAEAESAPFEMVEVLEITVAADLPPEMPVVPVTVAPELETEAPESELPVPEVAPEPVRGESPAMTESSAPPPESPEAAAVVWPGVEADASAAASGSEEAELPVMSDVVAPLAEPALVVTESMAELFLKQGHRELALAVYRQLRDRDPSLLHLEQVIAGLEAELRPPAEPVATRPSFAASDTGGERVQDFLGQVLQSPPPLASASVLPPAIEPVIHGEPTRPMEQPLSLGAVFGDEPPLPPRVAEEDAAAATAEPSYDEFFGAVGAGEPAPAGGAPSRSSDSEDLRQFNEWLKGLKR